MHDALRMHKHLDAVGFDAEEPLGFDDLEALVHQRSRVDGNLGAHGPSGVLEGVGGSDRAELLVGEGAEGTA